MAKSLAASKKLMQNYLSELLTEEQQEDAAPVIPVKEKTQQPLEKLLQNVDLTERIVDSIDESITTVKSTLKSTLDNKATVQAKAVIKPKITEKKCSTYSG